MILWILGGFVLLAGLQWFIIKRIPFRIVRVLVQVPLLAATVIVTLFLLSAQQMQAEIVAQQNEIEQIVDRTTIGRGDVVITVSATGSITPLRQVPLSFGLNTSPVDSILIDQGDRVAEGQLLATVVSTDFDQSVEDAEVALALQQISFDVLTTPASAEDIAVAQAQLEAADAQLLAAFSTGTSATDQQIAFFQTELARNQLWQVQLDRDGTVSPTPIEIDTEPLPEDAEQFADEVIEEINRQINATAGAQNRAAENAVITTGFGVDIADAQYEAALQRGADLGAVGTANAAVVQAELAYNQLIDGPTELQLAQAANQLALAELNLELAQTNLEQTTLVAPFAGLIAQNNLTVNELPPQGSALLLIDDSGYFVNLPIDETDITTVAIGQAVTFEVDALPDAIVEGTVTSIAFAPLSADELGLVAYNVRVDIASDTTDAIRPGMTVTGAIVTNERLDVVRVPNQFLRVDRLTGDVFVTVLTEDGDFQERQIALGARNDLFSEVLAGISVGEEVVLLPRTDDDTDADTGIGG